MKYISMLLAVAVLSGCSTTLESKMKDIQYEAGMMPVTILDTVDQNWILILIMMNRTGHILTIPVDNYSSLPECLEMWAEYKSQVPEQDKSQQLLCLLDNSPNTSSHAEIPFAEDRGIVLEEVTDEII